jgi:peroxiredoxin
MISGEAPDFSLQALKGSLTSLHGLLASGPLLLAFFKVSCPTCQLTLPFLERLYVGRSPDAPQIVAISQDDASATHSFNLRYGISLPVLLDPSAVGVSPRFPASNAYGITNVPTLFFIEPDRRISLSVTGFEKAVMESLGVRFGVTVFRAADRVPVFQPG